MIKNLPAMQETQIRSLGWEDHPEKGMGTHSSILAWKIPWTEEPGGLQSMSCRVRHGRVTNTSCPPLDKAQWWDNPGRCRFMPGELVGSADHRPGEGAVGPCPGA